MRFAKAVEKYNLMWLEDMLTGDYVPFVNADVYRELTHATTTPIHTGEQIYLRQNFKELIETQCGARRRPRSRAMSAELPSSKWIAEYADAARHADGAARHRQRPARPRRAGAGLRDPAVEFHRLRISQRQPPWWYDIVDGLPDPIVKNGLIDVWDRPGMGVDLIPEAARRYLGEEDGAFFD